MIGAWTEYENDWGMDGVRELIAQIRTALAADLYFLALIGALALPDICAGLAADNARPAGLSTRPGSKRTSPSKRQIGT
jgi:hypothetical protein